MYIKELTFPKRVLCIDLVNYKPDDVNYKNDLIKHLHIKDNLLEVS